MTVAIKKSPGTYATGRRKVAAARVWIRPGSGKITVNHRDFDKYFVSYSTRQIAIKPFLVTDSLQKFDVFCTVRGGGFNGQAGALCHGISRALVAHNKSIYFPIIKPAGLLTRDDRMVESKKYGRHKARKATQYSKR